jgi:aminoglycoside 3-N-acetyltransferase
MGDIADRRHEIVAALGRAGYSSGRDLLVHSAYSSVKKALSGPDELIEALAGAVGPTGRLLFPALSYENVTPDNPVFDISLTRGCVGFLAERFRTRWAEARSMHPTHSASGIGPGIADTLGAHSLDSTPVGPHSPFAALRETGGMILMLGCGLEPSTSMHGVEELVEPDYLYGGYLDYRLVAADGSSQAKRYRVHGFGGIIQRYDRLERVMREPELVRFRLLGADCWLVDAKALWRRAAEVMRRESRYFVDAEAVVTAPRS